MALKEIRGFLSSLIMKLFPTRSCRQPMKLNVELPSEFRNKEGYGNASRDRCIVYIDRKYYIGKSKVCLETFSASSAPNQQINGKEGKGKKRNDNGIAFDYSPTRRAKSTKTTVARASSVLLLHDVPFQNANNKR